MIDVRADSPLKAIEAMKTTTDSSLVKKMRSDLLAYRDCATPVKVNGEFYGSLARADVTPETVRNAIDLVISRAPGTVTEGAAASLSAMP